MDELTKLVEEIGEGVALEYETLTDGSVAHNVLYTPSEPDFFGTIRLACENEKHALDLADLLGRVVWHEVAHHG